MPGPPPKDPSQRRRRNKDRAEDILTKLPPGGRVGDPPAFPLEGESDAELALWVELWATPQAAAWEALGWTRVVARYCRLCIQAEQVGAKVTLSNECRQLEDRLGLTPLSMLRLRWKVDDADDLDEKRESKPRKDRGLKAVDDRAVAGS